MKNEKNPYLGRSWEFSQYQGYKGQRKERKKVQERKYKAYEIYESEWHTHQKQVFYKLMTKLF